MIPVLRQFQDDLIDGVREERRKGHRIVVMQSATGSGKTVTCGGMTKQAVAKGSMVLFLVHRRRLVSQICQTLEDFQINHGVVMAGERPFANASVQVASRDTIMSRVFRNEWRELPPADLVIVDEAHRAAAEDSDYRQILARYPKATIVLTTATPVGPDGKGLGPWAQAIVCGPPVPKLIDDGFLVPVRCFAPDRKMGKKVRKRGIAGDLVQSWKDFAEDQPTILFTSRVQYSLDAVDAYNKAGISAVHVDASTPDDDRDRAFDRLGTGDVKVVSNVGIVKEGVDVPVLGCCQIYMNMDGRVAFLQCCGRIMRPFAGKQYGILIDHGGAVFRHGFPDESQEWTLEGNADEAYVEKKNKGETPNVHYCKHCELLYKDQLMCPLCKRMPAPPPKSLFAPPPIESSDELLVEADRGGPDVYSHEEKVRHVGVMRKEWEAQQGEDEAHQEEDDGTEDPGGSGATSETTEEPKRSGRDGKRHPAKRKKTDDEPILCDRCKRVGAVKDCPQCWELVKAYRADRKKKKKADPRDAAEVVVDAFRNPVPDRLRKMYRDPWLQTTIDFLAEAEAAIRKEDMADGMHKRARHFPYINSKDVIDGIAIAMNALEDVLEHLKENRPAGVCPACKGDSCAKCKQAGMVPRELYAKLAKAANEPDAQV